MLSSLFLATVASPALGVALPAEIEAIPAVHIRVEERRCRIESHALEPLWLLLASDDRGALVLEPLPPGAVLDVAFPCRAAAGSLLEVLAPLEGGWASSGALTLGPRAGRESQTLEIFESTAGLAPFEDRVLAPWAATLTPSWFSEHLVTPDEQLEASFLPLHVPLPKPSDKPPGDSPPDVGDEPLPPV